MLDAGSAHERIIVSRALLAMLDQFSRECSQLQLKQSGHHSEFGTYKHGEITQASPEAALQHFESISGANSLLLRTTILSQLCAKYSLLKGPQSNPSDTAVTEPVAAESSEVEASNAAPTPTTDPHARPAFDFDAEVESCAGILGDVSTFLQSVQRFVLPEIAMFVANRPDSTQCMEDVLRELDVIEEVMRYRFSSSDRLCLCV